MNLDNKLIIDIISIIEVVIFYQLKDVVLYLSSIMSQGIRAAAIFQSLCFVKLCQALAYETTGKVLYDFHLSLICNS